MNLGAKHQDNGPAGAKAIFWQAAIIVYTCLSTELKGMARAA